MRKRKIGQYGNSWVIKLKPQDVIDFGLVKGDEVDIDDLNLMEEDDGDRKKLVAYRK